MDPDATIRPTTPDATLHLDASMRHRAASVPDEYRLLDQLGQGGMGIVYRAKQPRLGRDVAVKVLRPELRDEPHTEAFVAEARVTSLLDHPNVVPVHELVGSDSDEIMLAMKLVDGTPWKDLLHGPDGSDLDRNLEILLAVCNAVAYAHSKGIIHRDLKPENVMVGRFGEVLVMDWGLAIAIGEEPVAESGVQHKSSVTQVSGTPSYMAPEMAEGRGDDLGPWTDVYLLGAVLYEIVTHTRPHAGDTVVEVIEAAARAEPPTFPPDIPDELARICIRAMHRDARKRHHSVADFQDDLRTFVRHKESIRIADDAVRLLATCSDARAGDASLYRRLDEAVAAFRQARSLWSQNAAAIEGERSARLLQADVAIRSGDFALAETALEGLESKAAEDARERAHAGIVARRRNEARARVLRRVVVAGCVVIVAGLAIGLALVDRERQRADANAERWRAALDEVGRLTDVTELAQLEREAEKLWPAVPDNKPQFVRWLKRARDLEDGLASHRATLHSLRQRALPYTEEDRIRDHPEAFARLRRDEAWADRLEEAADATQDPRRERDIRRYIAGLEPVIAGQQRRLAALRRWHFDDPLDEWRHDVLERLIVRLEAFFADGGLVADVESRLALADQLERRAETDAALWRAAAAEVARDPRFAGLKLQPQVGLVPVGNDPQSRLPEFLHLPTHEGDIPARAADGSLPVTEATGVILVLIPSGTLVMGAQADDATARNHDPDAVSWERPVHEVQLAPYFIARHELTQAQWMRLNGSNPSKYAPGYAKEGLPPVTALHPVEQVSWTECDETLRRVGLVLPTEAQWEWAARGGTSTRWWTGPDADSLVGAANFSDRASRKSGAGWGGAEALERDDGYHVHAPVNSMRANPYGLHHVHGNLWEWCKEWYDSYRIPVDVGTGERIVFRGKGRAMRGGSYSGNPMEARVTNRYDMDPNVRVPTIGVRPARRLE